MRKLYPYLAPSTTADHIVIGGGAIGLAVAAGLANTAGKNRTTFLVERNSLVSDSKLIRGVGLLKVEVAGPGNHVRHSNWNLIIADRARSARNSEVIHSGEHTIESSEICIADSAKAYSELDESSSDQLH
jgi:L-2-hydroxyglutarate oxidase LhgO